MLQQHLTPPGATTVRGWEVDGLPVQRADRPGLGLYATLWTVDAADPLLAGAVRLHAGRLPAAADEVLLGTGASLDAAGWRGGHARPRPPRRPVPSRRHRRPGRRQPWVAARARLSGRAAAFLGAHGGDVLRHGRTPGRELLQHSRRGVGQHQLGVAHDGPAHELRRTAARVVGRHAAAHGAGHRRGRGIRGQRAPATGHPRPTRRHRCRCGPGAAVPRTAGLDHRTGRCHGRSGRSAWSAPGESAIPCCTWAGGTWCGRDLLVIVLTTVVVATFAALLPTRALAKAPVLTALSGRAPVVAVRAGQLRMGVLGIAFGLVVLGMSVSAAQGSGGGTATAAVALSLASAGAVLAGVCALTPVIVDRWGRVGTPSHGSGTFGRPVDGPASGQVGGAGRGDRRSGRGRCGRRERHRTLEPTS